ncbi:MAG: phosphatidate cytidylyltransferase [Desulfobulbaceae bacterium]|nr:phosphatidate cytidylyltransferase [Desulfobulbaceae bacterium]HKJ14879.1 phosphatidate cytidylyltransferase [Desulfobulbales bacterium]
MGRIVTGLILACSWLLLLLAGTYPFFCLVITAGGGVALYEFLRMSSPGVEQKHIPFVLILGISPIVSAALWGSGAVASSLFLILLVLIIITIVAYPSLENGLLFISRIWFGIIYIGFCSAHLILLYSLPQGIYWLLVLTAITVSSDSGAYYVGRTLGKTKLYPALSPGKTRAGAVGGIMGGMLGGLLVAAILFAEVNLAMVAILSLVLSAIGIIGDLIESLIKRVSGVKDSGQILPGHGGLLDRCDSLLLTAPALYYALLWGHAIVLK